MDQTDFAGYRVMNRDCCESLSGNDVRRLKIPRCGKLVVSTGQLTTIQQRLFPLAGSSAQIWIDARLRPLHEDHCCLYYSASRAIPGYITLDYVRSGPRTTLRSFRGALLMLDEIARLRSAVAIFAHIGTTAISDRLLIRWGWEPHAQRLPGRHWVKRFYNGYPQQAVAHLGPLAIAVRQLSQRLRST